MSATPKKGVPLLLNIIFALLTVGLASLLVLLFISNGSVYTESKPNELTPDFSSLETTQNSPWDTHFVENDIVLSKTVEPPVTTTETDDSFIFEDSNSRYLTEYELYGMSDWDLRVARNEIYARYGRMFEDEALREHFMAQDWYEPLYTAEEMDAFGESIFNDYEIYNLDLITKIETELGYR